MSFAQVPEDVFNHVSSFLPPPRPRDRERGDKLGGRVSLVCRGWLDFGRARGWKVLEIRGHELEDWMNFFGANPQLSPFVREVFFSVDDFRQEDSRSGGPSSTALLDLLNLFDNLRKFDSLDHSCHCDSRIFPLFALKSNLLSLTLDLARLDVPLFVPSLSQGFATLNYLYLHFDDVSPSDPLTPPSETCLPHLRSLRLSSNSSGRFLSILPDLFDFEKLSTVSLEGGGLTLSSTAQLESLNLGYGLRSLKLSFAPDALESLLENLTKMLSKLQSLENLDIDTGHGLTCIKSKEACRNFLEATGPEIRKIEIGGVVFESIGSFASVEWKDISMSQVEVQVRLAEGREYRKLVRIVDGNGERKWVFLVPSLSSRSAVCVMMDVPSSSSCRMFVPNRIDHLRAHFADHRIGQ